MTTLLQQTLKAQNTERVPIWFMRQAGRYLPEYRKVRESWSFLQMTENPEIAAEITLQPVERFNLDAAIIFADIMTLLTGLGIQVSFEDGPPSLDFRYEGQRSIDSLRNRVSIEAIAEKLSFFRDSLSLARKNLSPDKSLLGFAAAPFTLASYLVEGTTSKTHNKTRAYMFSHPQEFASLLNAITDATAIYLEMQHAAGADVVQIFESWGDAMHPVAYSEHILPSLVKLVSKVSKTVPVIVFHRGSSILRETLLPLYEAGASAVSVDWRMDINFFGDLPVQGNLDPAFLEGSAEAVVKGVKDILSLRGHKPGLIFNLGHGISPQANLEAVSAMVETVQKHRF